MKSVGWSKVILLHVPDILTIRWTISKGISSKQCWAIRKNLWLVYRVEYQQRGSPHIHMMIENVPVFGEDSDSKVTSFIG